MAHDALPERRAPTIAILGAGAAGLCMAIQLKRAGFTAFTLYEKSSQTGGTWRDNTYPGAGCDVPSFLYCFSFEPKRDWSRKFAEQPEIKAYFEALAERYDLLPHLRRSTEIAAARFDERAGQWTLTTSAGETITADVVISAMGQLNRPHVPCLPGLDAFEGTAFHSARWDHRHDLTGETVAVIGNGASAVQFIPRIAPRVKKLHVFQRSPTWILPREDRAYQPWETWLLKHLPLAARLYRSLIYWSLEARFLAFSKESWVHKKIVELTAEHLRAQVPDPHLLAQLTPDYPIGCKRVLISDDYYPALMRPNVELVTSPIDRITTGAIVTGDGTARPVDTIILATGFEATRFLVPLAIEGIEGEQLEDAWRGGALAHLGMMVAGFPNFFMLYGPNTNLGHNSILFMIECQARYIVQCIRALGLRDLRYLDVRRDVMDRYNAELQRDLARSPWAGACTSWYKTPSGKVTNNWSGFTVEYWWRTRRPDLGTFHQCARSADGS